MRHVRLALVVSVLVAAAALWPVLPHPAEAQGLPPQTVRVITPNGGEKWIAGRVYLVGWSTLGIHDTSFSQKPKIELVDEAGLVIHSVEAAESFGGVDDDDFGRARLFVPTTLLGKQFTVRVSVYDDQVPGIVIGSSAGIVSVVSEITEKACLNQQLVQETALYTRDFANLGLDTSAHADIIRYRVRWPTGDWLGWFTPGVDDVDWRWNSDGSKRRVWAYFGDYQHEYLVCYDQAKRVDRLVVPQAGAYALEASWFKSPGTTYFFNPREEFSLSEAASAGSTTLKLTGAINLNRTYLIYNLGRKVAELIGAGHNSISGINITLEQPLQNYYGSDDGSRAVALFGAYSGYCPSVAGQISLGHLDLGTEISVGHITVLPNSILGPFYSSNPDYYYIEQVGTRRHKILVDDGRHEGWSSRSEAASYTSAQIDLFGTTVLPADQRLVLQHGSASGAANCGTNPKATLAGNGALTSGEAVIFSTRLLEHGYTVSEKDRTLVLAEAAKVVKADAKVTQRWVGKFVSLVPGGVRWYVHAGNGARYLVRDGAAAYALMQAAGTALSSADINKIPVGLIQTVRGPDRDGDRLDDVLEQALGTNPEARDSDGDKVADRVEIARGTNPLGIGRLTFDAKLARRYNGLFVIQDGSLVWYVSMGKRYFVRDATAAASLIRTIGTSIRRAELGKISVVQPE